MTKRTKKSDLTKLADDARPRTRDESPDSDNPLEVVRQLVAEHKARDREIRRRMSAAREFIELRDGTKVKSALSADDRASAQLDLDGRPGIGELGLRQRQDVCVRAMKRELKRIPIYQHFLGRVAGMPTVLAAYLVSLVDIHRAVKPSGLKRFCGAVPDKTTGRLEKPRALTSAEIKDNAARIKRGERPVPGRHYCQEIRVQCFLWQGLLMREGHGFGRFNKYLTAWDDFRRSHEGEPGKGLRKGAWRATGIMLDDLYMIWRALEGLPVWPDWYAAKLGYSHGGKICVREPKMLALDEALALVGEPGWLGPRVAKLDDTEHEAPTESGVGLVDGVEDEGDDLAAEYMVAKGVAV